MSDIFKHKPPRWADRFLKWFCNPRLLEQVQGDVHELFYWRLEEKGPSKAKKSFIWDVVRLFRWSNIKRSKKRQKLNNMGIFKNYFKIGVRNLWKQRMPSTINIIGLSIAIGCAIVVFKFVEHNYVKDNFHDNLSELYLVTHWEQIENENGRNGAIDNQLSKEILNNVPGIKAFTRYDFNQLESKVDNSIKYNAGIFVDPDFTDMFSFELLEGNLNSLKSADQIIMDEQTAVGFFGERSALDQKVELKIGEEWKAFTVGAVYKNKPMNSSIQLEILIHQIHYEQLLSTRKTWNTSLFIQVAKEADPLALEQAMDKLVPLYNKGKEDRLYTSFELEPLATMALNSRDMTNGIGQAPQMAPIITISAIGIFMILLSTLNYINISLAMVMKRLKEIGVRKVIGSRRSQLVSQFVIENFLLCSFAMVLGFLFAKAFFLPGFNDIAGGDFQIDLFNDYTLILFLSGLLIVITLVSGLYPAIVASSFKPISILRKSTQRSSNKLLSNIFLTFQMIMAMVTIVAAVMFVYTNRVNESMEWGYDQYNKLVLGIPGDEHREMYRDVLESNPDILAVAGTRSNVGQTLNGVEFKNNESSTYAELFAVGRNYPQVLGLELVSGRFFNQEIESDLDHKLVVNETFLERLQLEFDPDGTFITQDSVTYSIIGVVKDYQYYDPSQEVRGAAMMAIPAEKFSAYLVQMSDGDIFEQQEELRSTLQENVKERTVYVGIQELIFENFFEEMKGIRNIMLFTASVAILLAAMGLYGLVNINVANHIKDYGIRKVLGANGMSLTKTIVKRFRFVLLFAILIGCPIAVMLVGALINDIYAYAPAIGVGPMSVAIIILLGVAFFTLNIQILKVRKMNPAETLRTE